MKVLLHRWLTEDDGSNHVEYVLLGATVAFAGLAGLTALDAIMNAVYQSWDFATQAIWEPEDPQ
jgi:Flp pilus assembly pilin Flp